MDLHSEMRIEMLHGYAADSRIDDHYWVCIIVCYTVRKAVIIMEDWKTYNYQVQYMVTIVDSGDHKCLYSLAKIHQKSTSVFFNFTLAIY